jgi:hypothetical protein
MDLIAEGRITRNLIESFHNLLRRWERLAF